MKRLTSQTGMGNSEKLYMQEEYTFVCFGLCVAQNQFKDIGLDRCDGHLQKTNC